MRASATSRISPSAGLHAAQAKADANKADAASPFALLVEMASSKDPAKPAKKDAQDSGHKPADNKSPAGPDDKAAAANAAPQPRATASAKAGKADKNKDKDSDTDGAAAKIDDTASDNSQVASAAPQLIDLQTPPPAPVMQTAIAALPTDATGDDTGNNMPVGGVSATDANPAAKPSSDTPPGVPDPTDAPATPDDVAAAPPPAAAQAPAAAQPDDDQAEEPTAPVSVAASQSAAARAAAQPDGKAPAPGKDSTKTAAAKAVVQIATADNAKSDAAAADAVKAAADAAGNNAGPGHGAIDDVANSNAAKDHAAQGDPAKAAANKSTPNRSDANAGNAHKTAESQPDPSQLQADSVDGAAAPKSAPQPAPTANASFAINAMAAPQAAQHSHVLTLTPQMQASAQAAANLPALAVEIAAKSQSGARQFDIRLDPPELGRVDVRLSIDATGKASAHLSADQPQTLTLLQKDAPVLTRALRDAGLDVSQNGLNFSLRQQSDGQQNGAGNNGRFGTSRAFALTASPAIDATATTIAYRGVVDGRLDIRV